MKKSAKVSQEANEFYNTYLSGTTPSQKINTTAEDEQRINEYYNQQEAVGEVLANTNDDVSNDIRASIEKNAEVIEGVYIIDNANLIQSLQFVGDVSASSGLSGLAEDIGIKNAQKSLVKKVKTLNGNVVLITECSTDWGVKIKGKTYVC